jgi:hypothetical protein
VYADVLWVSRYQYTRVQSLLHAATRTFYTLTSILVLNVLSICGSAWGAAPVRPDIKVMVTCYIYHPGAGGRGGVLLGSALGSPPSARQFHSTPP